MTDQRRPQPPLRIVTRTEPPRPSKTLAVTLDRGLTISRVVHPQPQAVPPPKPKA